MAYDHSWGRGRYTDRDSQDQRPAKFGKGNEGRSYSRGKGGFDSVCWKCQETGHLGRDCPTNSHQASETSRSFRGRTTAPATRGDSPPMDLAGLSLGQAAPAASSPATSAFGSNPFSAPTGTSAGGSQAGNPFGGFPVGGAFLPRPPATPPPMQNPTAPPQGSSAPEPNGQNNDLAQFQVMTAPPPALLLTANPASRTSQVPPGTSLLDSRLQETEDLSTRVDEGRASTLEEDGSSESSAVLEAKLAKVQREKALRLLEEREKAAKQATDANAIRAIEQRLAAHRAQHPVAVAEAMEKIEMEAIQRTAALMLEAKRTAMNRMVMDIGTQIQIQLSMMEIEQIHIRRDYAWQVNCMYKNFVLGLLRNKVPVGWKHTWEPMIQEPEVLPALPEPYPHETCEPTLADHPALVYGPQLNPTQQHSGLIWLGEGG